MLLSLQTISLNCVGSTTSFCNKREDEKGPPGASFHEETSRCSLSTELTYPSDDCLSSEVLLCKGPGGGELTDAVVEEQNVK